VTTDSRQVSACSHDGRLRRTLEAFLIARRTHAPTSAARKWLVSVATKMPQIMGKGR
jgi:hypothetical protein